MSGASKLPRERLNAGGVPEDIADSKEMDSEDLRRKRNAAFTAKKFDEAVALYTLVSTTSTRREKRA